jgi:YHS domain-containing protein
MKKNSRVLTLFLIFSFILALSGIAQQQIEELVTCPVSGKEIKKSEAKATYEYKGKTYYFCCEKCKEIFLKEPEKYIEKKKEMKEIYICPMHPEVKSDKPSKCFKCGMKLEKKVIAKKHICAHMKTKEKVYCPLISFAQCKDVEVKIENLEHGVIIKITSENAEVVKKIQEKAAKMKSCCTRKMEKCKKEKTKNN